MPYFTEAELRDLPGMNDTATYTTARVTTATNWIEALIERKVGTSFISRTWTETHDGDLANIKGGILLGRPFLLTVSGVTSNGVAFTGPQLAALELTAGGFVIRRSAGSYIAVDPWDPGTQNIDVTYTSGYSLTPPADIKEAALTAARDWLLRRYAAQGVSDRAMSLQTDLGQIVYATASDSDGRPTGLPDVDAVIMGWRDRLTTYGFA